MVELKSKRRSASDQSPSIWGNAAPLFKTEPDRSSTSSSPKAEQVVLARQAVEVARSDIKQPKRVLPDLRMVESVPLEEAQPIRVRRNRMGGRRTMSETIQRQGELQVDTASISQQEAAEPTPANEAEAVGLDAGVAASEDTLWEANAPLGETAPAPQPASESNPDIVSGHAMPRGRKWTRRVEDLPRGERWKRRLPEVCR